MKIALVDHQTVHTVLFRVTTLNENEVQTEAAKILLHNSSKKTSKKTVNETESRLKVDFLRILSTKLKVDFYF